MGVGLARRLIRNIDSCCNGAVLWEAAIEVNLEGFLDEYNRERTSEAFDELSPGKCLVRSGKAFGFRTRTGLTVADPSAGFGLDGFSKWKTMAIKILVSLLMICHH